VRVFAVHCIPIDGCENSQWSTAAASSRLYRGPFKSSAHLFQGMSETVNPTTNNKNASMSRNVSSADDGADGRNNTSHVSKLVATYSMGRRFHWRLTVKKLADATKDAASSRPV